MSTRTLRAFPKPGINEETNSREERLLKPLVRVISTCQARATSCCKVISDRLPEARQQTLAHLSVGFAYPPQNRM